MLGYWGQDNVLVHMKVCVLFHFTKDIGMHMVDLIYDDEAGLNNKKMS